MYKKTEYLCTFLAGGVLYNLIELLWRGYTHWSMTIAGGLCVVLIHLVNQYARRQSLFIRCAIGALLITTVEFCAGVVFNLMLGMNVWDYSHQPGNLLGQICPLFTFLWFLLSFPAFWFSSAVGGFFLFLKRREIQTT